MLPADIITIGGNSWLFTAIFGFLMLGLLAGLAGGIAASPPEKRRQTIFWSAVALAVMYGLATLAGIPSSYAKIHQIKITGSGEWILKNTLGVQLDTLPAAEPKRLEWYGETLTWTRPYSVTYLTGLRLITDKRTYDTVTYNDENAGELEKIKTRLDQRIQESGAVLPKDVNPPLPAFFWRYQQDMVMLLIMLFAGTSLLIRYVKSWRKHT